MTKEEREFFVSCDSFKNYTSIDEYIVDTIRYLTLSSWQYSENEAKELIERDKSYIKDCFKKKEPVADVAVDVGYNCG